MTLNITKKKIEKVLELFNHPQTRKIRKNRGKKRRRNNKSFNRKNGRKNLATSTLKKKGGHAGHHPSLFNGGVVGPVLGGQVGGDMKENFQVFVNKYKDLIGDKYKELIGSNKYNTDNNTTKTNFVKKIYKNFIAKFQTKQEGITTSSETYSPLNNEFNKEFDDIMNSDNDSKNSVNDLLNFDLEDIEETNLSTEEKEMFDVIFPIILPIISVENNIEMTPKKEEEIIRDNSIAKEALPITTQKASVIIEDQQNQSNTTEPEQPKSNEPEKSNETKKEETKSKESKEIDTSEMLKVALASNYFTQYGILSGMLKMNQDKNKDNFDVMKFVQDPKLYAEFCNKMGFQFAEMKEEPVVENKAKEENPDADSDKKQDANSDTDSEEEKD